jgi:PhnB protein
MHIQPYLYFNGCCEEAVEFYRRTLGAQVEMMMRIKDSPEPPPPGAVPPGSENKIMHVALKFGDTMLLASDGSASGPATFRGFALSLNMADAASADRAFASLADGGSVQMPLTETFWSPRFGMLTDRFGVAWMVNLTA